MQALPPAMALVSGLIAAYVSLKNRAASGGSAGINQVVR